MMRTVYIFEFMLRLPVVTQCLNVLIFLFREPMPCDVEPKRATECYI
jgi:hypothetical protein